MSVPLRKPKAEPHQSTPALPVMPTKYEASPVTLINFPSSVMNGVTAENGLYSLTFKSISCYKLVDNLDMMRRVLIDQQNTVSETVVSETHSSLEAMLKSLGETSLANVEESRNLNHSISSIHEEIESFRSNESEYSALKSKVELVCGQSIGREKSPYAIPVLDVKIPGLEVSSIDDVLNVDMSVYETA